MTTRDEQLQRLFLQSAIAARNTARAERDKAHELVRALTEETVEWRKQRDAARVELSFNRALVAKAGDDINRLLKDMLELEAERDAARADRDEARSEYRLLVERVKAVMPYAINTASWVTLLATIGVEPEDMHFSK